MSYVFNQIRDRSQAEDLTQEVFLKVYRNRINYEPKAKFSTWLWTIARNTCIDYFRKGTSVETPFSDPADLDHVESPISDAQYQLIEHADRARFEECLTELTDTQREAILLRTMSELSYDEISTLMKLTLSTIKSHLFRAKTSLLDCLNHEKLHRGEA